VDQSVLESSIKEGVKQGLFGLGIIEEDKGGNQTLVLTVNNGIILR